MAAMTALARARSARSPTRRSSTPTAAWPRDEGVFCEPASAARRGRAAAQRRRGRRADRLRAHRPRAQGPADRARPRRLGRAVRARHRRRRAGRARMHRRRRVVRVPASSANLGPGFDVLAAALGAARRGRGGGDRALRGRTPTSQIARDRRNLAVRGFARLHPADDFEFRIRSDIPLSGGLGHERRGLRRRAARRRLDLRARRRPPRRSRRGSRATPTTSPRRCSAASWSASTARRRASTRPPGSRRCSSCPHAPVRTAKARAALPAQVPMADAVFNVGHAACWCSASRRATSTSSRAGSHDRLHQPRRAPLYPQSMALAAPRAASSARSARRSRAPARPCWSGRTTRRRGAVVERLRAGDGGLGGGPARARSSRRAPTCGSSRRARRRRRGSSPRARSRRRSSRCTRRPPRRARLRRGERRSRCRR